jgi:hypothetical protein
MFVASCAGKPVGQVKSLISRVKHANIAIRKCLERCGHAIAGSTGDYVLYRLVLGENT